MSGFIDGRNKSAIRTDWRTARRSAYNYDTALVAYRRLLETVRARYILTSYSTDGKIPVEAMAAAAAEHGKLSCVLHPYKRYRVSTQRMSVKPMNVEFVLTIDTSRPGSASQAEEIVETLLKTEDHAVSNHPESLAGAV
jgi:adenine-specific DNA-methyltransferase